MVLALRAVGGSHAGMRLTRVADCGFGSQPEMHFERNAARWSMVGRHLSLCPGLRAQYERYAVRIPGSGST